MRRIGLAVLVWVCCFNSGSADEGELPAWEQAAAPAEQPLQEPEILELSVARASPVDARLLGLTRDGRWGDAAAALAKVRDDPKLGSLVVRPWGRWSGALVGAREDARRRLHALPPAALQGYRSQSDPLARDLLWAPQARREAALAELLTRYSASTHGSAASRLLGERLLERGDLDGALLFWRRALQDQPDPELALKVQALRTLLGAQREGSLQAARALDPGAWRVLWARRAPGGDPYLPRPLVTDGAQLYTCDAQGVVALNRDHGLLAWRHAAPGQPHAQHLSLARGVVVLQQAQRLLALDADDGTLLWELPAGEDEARFHDVAATPFGFVALVTREARRTLIGLTPTGQLQWQSTLWTAPSSTLTRWWELRYRPPADPEDPGLSFVQGGVRAVVGDGRLATLAERVLVTIDGLVLAVSALEGDVIWLRERLRGLEVHGERVLVDLRAGPYAVEAVTGAGHLVRCDPLDGRSLPLPQPPAGPKDAPEPRRRAATPDHQRPYVLALDPTVCLYRHRAGEYLVTKGATSAPLARLAIPPLGPGSVHGDLLWTPDHEGAVVFDLQRGRELGLVPWPLGPGSVRSVGGLLVLASPDGVAVLSQVQKRAAPSPTAGLSPGPQRWIKELESLDWQLRLQAQKSLLALGDEAVPYLRKAAREAKTFDARDLARHLAVRLERRVLFSELAPDASPGLLQDLVDGVRPLERLRTLRDLVPVKQDGSDTLRQHVREAADPEVQRALLEILIRVDRKARQKLASVLANAEESDALRHAVGRLLAELATRTGVITPLEEAFRAAPTSADFVIQALVESGDRSLLNQLLPLIRHRLVGQNWANPRPVEGDPNRALQLAIPKLLE